MVTNYPQRLTATGTHRELREPRTGVLLARGFRRLTQLLCGLGGHDSVRHFEGKRVMMRCTSCGHDTPGWEVASRGPRRRFDGDPRRHRLSPPTHLVLKRSA